MTLTARSPGKHLAKGLSVAVVGFAVVGGGVAIATGALTSGDRVVIQPLPGAVTGPAPVWPENAKGQTYGSVLNSANSATEPDLVQVMATTGKTGYAYWNQLNPPAPSSPAGAVAQQAANTTGTYIPVYAQDGTTVIGRFEAIEPSAAAGSF